MVQLFTFHEFLRRQKNFKERFNLIQVIKLKEIEINKQPLIATTVQRRITVL